jgi:hypothetical protein
MRDLYNRKKRLEYWVERIQNDLDDQDRNDVLRFVEHLQEKDNSILWIIRCITALLAISRQLVKPFKNTTKEDIKLLFKWMERKNYKASTHEKFRVILKLFYKVIYGNNENYPEQVKWFSVQVGKEITSKEKNLDIEEYLEEEEIIKIVSCITVNNKF